MAASQLVTLFGCLRQLVRTPADSSPDSTLLEGFVRHGETAAFETIVQRHGGLVYRVCQRVLDDQHDAEDAFQTTFLVLARKAGAIHKRASLGAWLHGVALRVARRIRVDSVRRKQHEQRVLTGSAPDPALDLARRELRPLLDEELDQLPDKYRLPLILCYLQGKTNEQAAQELGWTRGTVSGRLARARDLLRGRLLRRGVTLATATLLSSFAEQARARVPFALAQATTQAAVGFSVAKLGVAGSTGPALLAEGVLQTMMMTKVKMAVVAVVLLAAGLTTGTGIWMQQAQAQKPADRAAHNDEIDRLKQEIELLRAQLRAAQLEIALLRRDAAARDARADREPLRELGTQKEDALRERGARERAAELLRQSQVEQEHQRLQAAQKEVAARNEQAARERARAVQQLMEVHKVREAQIRKALEAAESEKKLTEAARKDYIRAALEQLARAQQAAEAEKRAAEAEHEAARKTLEEIEQRLARLSADAQKQAAEADKRAAEAALEVERKAKEALTKDAQSLLHRVLTTKQRQDVTNQLKQIGLGFHQYLDVHSHFPSAAIHGDSGKPMLSWRVALLPFLGEEKLYKEFHLDEPWDSEHNKKLLAKMPKIYSAGLPTNDGRTPFRVFVGKGAAFEGATGRRIADFTDGLSNTILVVEAPQTIEWTRPEELPYGEKLALPKLGDNVRILMGDGAVHVLKDDKRGGSEKQWRALITRAGGEVLEILGGKP